MASPESSYDSDETGVSYDPFEYGLRRDIDSDETKPWQWYAFCKLPVKTGPCRAHTSRYYFSQKDGKCKKFIFGGCRGNENNFKTHKECEKRCGGNSKCLSYWFNVFISKQFLTLISYMIFLSIDFKCKGNLVYYGFPNCRPCYKKCGKKGRGCTRDCTHGCGCPQGYVMSSENDSKCIKEKDCKTNGTSGKKLKDHYS